MKVCLVSRSDGNGGAFKAAYRLHQGLLDSKVNSNFLVAEKTRGDYTILNSTSKLAQEISRFSPYFDRLPLKLYPQRRNEPFSLQWFPDRVMDQINSVTPDIINLHWVNAGYIQIETLAKLKKPIVWTLHDMWGFTGGCHYSGDCEGYKKTCGHCPQLGSQKNWDLSRWVWQRKAKAWQSLDLTLVTPSHWLAQQAKASSLFRETPIHVIANGLDLNRFKPIDQKVAKQIIGISTDKPLVLFGAIKATSDFRKGFHLLLPALQKLSELGWSDQLELVIFGASEPRESLNVNFKIHYLGYCQDELTLVLAYSACDVMVVPSLQEAFGQTASEALACGTPVVAFESTGLLDIIDSHHNGYLAKSYEIDDLAQGISWILEDRQRYEKLSSNARQKAIAHFGVQSQAHHYSSLFENLVAQ